MNLTAGVTLQNGKYVLNGILGESHLGITLKATQAYLNQPVVLKTLKLDAPDADVVALKQQFVETTRQIVQCQHPGLVRILDLFEESGLPFVVMDFVAGQRLLELVQTRSPLPEAQALNYIRQVGSAVSVIHRHHLLHRDIKPGNLICPPGANFVVLVDFGTVPHPRSSDADTPEKLSRHPYRAIEQYQPQATLSAATDVYALAATLYFLVTGQPPIAAPLREASPLVLPRQLQPHLSATVESAILSGMQPHARNRPQTIAAWFSLLPGSDTLPPVHAFASSNGATHATVQLPQTPAPAPNGHAAPAPSVPPPPTTAPTLHPVSLPESNGQPQRSAPPTVVTPVPARKSRMPKAIAATIAIAAACGMGIGLTLRLSAVTGIGPTFFNTQQTFPPRDDWGQAVQAPVDSVAPPPPPADPPPPTRLQSGSSRPPARIEAEPPQPSPVAPSPSPEPSIEATPSPAPSPVEALPLPADSTAPPAAVEAPPPVVPAPAPPTSAEPAPPAKPPEGI